MFSPKTSSSESRESKPLLQDIEKTSHPDDTVKKLYSLLVDLEYYTLCITHRASDKSLFGRFVDILAPSPESALKFLRNNLAHFSKVASQYKDLCEKKHIRAELIKKCEEKISNIIESIKVAYQHIPKNGDESIRLQKKYDSVLSPIRTIADAILESKKPVHEYKPG